MRIIGGEYRGRKLTPPTNKDIRPTSDRMRETIFNILSHQKIPLQGANVLDVFAGTGALGLEALSRGAAHATFFDQDPRAIQLVKKNATLLGAAEKTAITCASALDLPLSRRAYDFIFLDPPYNLDVINQTITSLRKKHYLSNNCLIIAEYSPDNPIEFPDFIKITKEKTYGEARFSFLEISS